MTALCVGILACNNEDEIADCLESVSWADERIVILDTRSNDRTAAIAEAMGARVVPHRFENFALQREYGLSLPDAEWLFYVDSDERATPALAREIRRVIKDETHVGWWVPRRNFMWGHEIHHGGWHPDYQLRLLKLGHAHYDMTREVHEVVELEGREYTGTGPRVHGTRPRVHGTRPRVHGTRPRVHGTGHCWLFAGASPALQLSNDGPIHCQAAPICGL